MKKSISLVFIFFFTTSLVNENLNAGVYSFDFKAGDLASGVYFYKLIAGDYSDIKKMTLLK